MDDLGPVQYGKKAVDYLCNAVYSFRVGGNLTP